MNKKKLAAVITGVVLILVVIVAIVSQRKSFAGEEKKDAFSYENALANGADLYFWYDDHAYDSYFQNAAISFYEEKGYVVQLEYVDVTDYVGKIYDVTMKNERFPDVYLLSGEELEKAYLYGVVKENPSTEAFLGSVATNAMKASTYREVLLGYPLSYNVCLLAYNKNYFTENPISLQAIIDYAKENDPDETVEYLLEWDVNDPFFNFLFVSESVKVTQNEIGKMSASYDEATLEASLLFLQESLESFAIPMESVSEESVLLDVLNEKTLCAIVDSSSLYKMEDSNYNIMEFPKLNEEIGSRSVALTDLILVNDFTTKENIADEFAKYVCLEKSDELWELSGNYSVKLHRDTTKWGEIVFQAYENAILAPNSHDEGGFWVDLYEMTTKYFE